MTQPKIEGTGHGMPRMIYGSDGSNWYAIQVDSDGHVKIDVVTSGLPTGAATEATLADIKTAAQLIDDFALGANKLFGYYGRYAERVVATSTGAGSTVAWGTKVPAGEIWVVQSLVGNHNDPVAREMGLGSFDGTSYYYSNHSLSLATNVRLFGSGSKVLKVDDRIMAVCTGLTSGQSVVVQGWGYKMKVA